ncbi:MAG: glycosyltransferase [Eubacteriales bacterium]|nr:glycosyltransferase [Eubacteriales bacterium]
MCRILISGYYGFDNAGDEAILQSLVSELKAACPGLEIMVLSANPSKTSVDFGVHSVSRSNIIKMIQAVKNCDILISGGGSLFQDTTSFFNVWYYGGIIMLAFAMKKLVFAYAQGIGPVSSRLNKKMLRFIFNRVNNISVRDIRSMRQLKAIGVKRNVSCTIDPAFLNKRATKKESFSLLKSEITNLESKIQISPSREKTLPPSVSAAIPSGEAHSSSVPACTPPSPGSSKIKPLTLQSRGSIAGKYGIAINDDNIIVSIFARLDAVKNVASFINAASIIKPKADNVRFLICGSGPDRNMLEHLAAKLDLQSRLFFLGHVRPADEIMKITDINVLTSLSESFPYSILEGAVLKKATVSSRVGGIPDLIENEVNGFLFDPGDDAELAEKIMMLASDTALRDKMGQLLYEKAKSEFSLESMCQTQLSIYNKILGGKAADVQI